MDRKIGECSICGGNLTIDHQCGPLYNSNRQEDEMEGLRDELLPCPFCGDKLEWDSDTCGFIHQKIDDGCILSWMSIDKSMEKLWNTRATDPLLEILKNEIKRLTMAQDEARLAALADDSVPRLVFKAAIEAIANKDTLLAEMAEALGDALRVCEWGEPQPKPVAKQIETTLQKYREATCQQEKK